MKDNEHELWEKSMYEKYPVLFKEHTLTRMQSCIGDGICVQPGWYSLVERLCESIKDFSVKTGIEIVAKQVKQKLGGLRFYAIPIKTDDIDGPIYELVREALQAAINNIEMEAERTCEACGKPGKGVTINGWIYTLCPRHALMLRNNNEEDEKEKTI